MVAWRQLLCEIIAAGSRQRIVEVGSKKKKKGNKQPEVRQREWWRGGIVAAGSRQRKVEVATKNRTKVTINRRCRSVSGVAARTAGKRLLYTLGTRYPYLRQAVGPTPSSSTIVYYRF